ncbi:MAG: ribonuclease H-like YkuK family protein [Bacteroidia bacterium]
MAWKTYQGEELNQELELAVEEVIKRLHAEGREIKLCIGTDSQVKGLSIDMVTVIVFRIIGNGGFMFVQKSRIRQKMSMRERMLTEVGASIGVADELREIAVRNSVDIEIHADINQDPKFPSQQAWQDAMGYTKGMGFTFVSKPDAYASSVCADRLCH